MSILGLLQEVVTQDTVSAVTDTAAVAVNAAAEVAEAAASGSRALGKALGAGLTVVGTGLGIGLIGSRMTESMARQPEIAGDIQTAAIILAALIEGAALFALVIAFLVPV